MVRVLQAQVLSHMSEGLETVREVGTGRLDTFSEEGLYVSLWSLENGIEDFCCPKVKSYPWA